MNIRFKPLKEQVIVITGASSGIGLVTARMASQRGARVMLTARNETALRQLTEEINGPEPNGGVAEFVAGDIAEEAVVRRVGAQARDRFGRIDTWVNAPVSRFTDRCSTCLWKINVGCSRRTFGGWSSDRVLPWGIFARRVWSPHQHREHAI